MMIALYRLNKAGHTDYYYIHDFQGNLFSPFTFTTIWGKNMESGKERSYRFETRREMDLKLTRLFKLRVKDGYKMLYTYPAENSYNNIFHDVSHLKLGKQVS